MTERNAGGIQRMEGRTSSRASWFWRVAALAFAGALLAFGAGACGDDDGDGAHVEVEGTVEAMITAYGSGDTDAFLATLTDSALAELMEVSEDEVVDLKEQLPEIIGEDPPVILGFSDTEVTGDTATTVANFESDGVLENDRFNLAKNGDGWIITEFDGYAVSPEIPSDYTTISMPVQEFAFGLDPSLIKSGEKVAFDIQNVGKQKHEAAMVSLADGVDLQEALAEALASGEEPAGLDLVARVTIEPGAQYNMVVQDELPPGRYAFVCFMPDVTDPEFTPHAFKGMVSEFTLE